MMIKPMLAEPAMISRVSLMLLGLLLLLAMIAGIIALVILLVRVFRKPSAPIKTPDQPPVAASTVKMAPPRSCPQCGAALQPDVPEGLCPACLLQRGIATEGGAPPGAPAFVPPTIPELTKLFPQLEILELIGKGGMGAVYKARQPALDRFVALKILAPRSGGDLDFAGRFSREARALARLNHPNIVGVFDFGRAELPLGQGAPQRVPTTPLHYFIMEFVDGPNLRQAGRLSPREAMEIIPQICTALQFAHDEGIVHRDIKPENVLLDKKGRVKIADFGLAKILGQEAKDLRLTGAKDIMGTPHYMAPEQVERPQDVDHRADIYSLGVVFYELLTGELPLGKFQSPSQKVAVDVRLDEVVLRSLAKEPELRYQHVSEMGTRVETIAGGRAESASPVSSAPSNGWNPLLRGAKVAGWIFLSCVLVSAVVSFLLPNMYETEAVLAIRWVADTDGATNSSTRPGFIESIMGAEANLLTSLPVLKKTASQLNLSKRWGNKFNNGKPLSDDRVAELLRQMIQVELPLRTPVLHLYCFSDSPSEAVEIANTLVQIYKTESLLDSNDRILRLDPQITILQSATIPKHPFRPNRPLNIFIGVMVGAGLGLLVGGIVAVVTILKSPRPARESVKPDRFWRWFAVVVACVLLIPVAIAILGTFAAMFIPAFVKAPNRAQAVAAHNQRALADPDPAGLFGHVGQTWFPKGDSIEILFVERSESEMKVKGLYNLISANNARLALYVTSTNDIATTEATTQSTLISQGSGDFELVYPHRVSGLPHVTMYAADGKGFAEVYFGSKDEAGAESKLELGSTNPAAASAETWSPPLAPGEKPDLQKILQDATKLMEVGHFEEALQHHLWYHRHALEYDPAQTGVRLSFALSDWVALGNRYPKAKQALLEIRDADVQALANGTGNFKLLQDVDSINNYLGDGEATRRLFENIEQRDLSLAKQGFGLVEDLLVQHGDYEKCLNYIGDPQAAFETIHQSRERMKNFEEQNSARRAAQNQRYQDMAKTNSNFANMPMLREPPPYADKRFVSQTRQLIEILVATEHRTDAEKIRDRALAILDDAQLKSAVTDAEIKIHPARKTGVETTPLKLPAATNSLAVATNPAVPATAAEDQRRELLTRISAAQEIVAFSERDTAMTGIARDAARAVQVELAKKALAQITAFSQHDAAALQVARELARRDQLAEAVAIARDITSFAERDAALKELAR